MDNFFDPSFDLSPDSSLQDWMQDPQAAEFIRNKAIEHAQGLGFASAQGMDAEGSNTPISEGSVPAGTPPPVNFSANPIQPPAEPAPTPNFSLTPQPGSVGDRIIRLLGSTFGSPAQTPQSGPVQGNVPIPMSDPRKGIASAGAALDPEPEPESVPLPRPRPLEANPRPSDVSARKKSDEWGDALTGFSKSLQGVKPVPPPAVSPVGTPAVRAPVAINSPNLQNLLALFGQQGSSPAAASLGRLLATGKA